MKKGNPFYRLLWSCVLSFVCIIYVRIMFVRRILVCAFSFSYILFGMVCDRMKKIKIVLIFGTSFVNVKGNYEIKRSLIVSDLA